MTKDLDWNDLHRALGPDAVREQFDAEHKRANERKKKQAKPADKSKRANGQTDEGDDRPFGAIPTEHEDELDDERFVPEEVRAAYRILKRAGFVPPEIEARKECVALTTLIAKLDDCAERRSALLKLALIRAKLEQRPPRTGT